MATVSINFPLAAEMGNVDPATIQEEENGNSFDQFPGWRTRHLCGYP
jgi:hypothetical protein